MSRRVALLFILATLLLTSCGANADLARQETVARARTCGNLTERRRNEPFAVPSTSWFSEKVEAPARRTGSEQYRKKKSNNGEMKDDCRLAQAFSSGSTFDTFRSAVTGAESSPCAASPGPPPTASAGCTTPGGG